MTNFGKKWVKTLTERGESCIIKTEPRGGEDVTQQINHEGSVFPLADTHKRYHTYDAWLKSTFGQAS